ncbi:MAG TPA: hypothetical protein ENN87_03920 [Phycisphaerales bacterium]|nr:hypothetical protein [Phycisphaerales bacterium]
MDPYLQTLLLNIEDLSDAEAEKLASRAYLEDYTDYDTHSGRRGERVTHDNQSVVFYEDRFEHAFFTTADKVNRPFNKSQFVRDRASRVRWIGEIIAGKLPGSECWLVYQGNVLKRLYVHWDECYVVWLEPTKTGKWKFSSAYTTSRADIRRKLCHARRIWTKK